MTETVACPLHGRQEFPIPRQDPMLPPAEFSALRTEGPAARVRMWDGSTAWLVTRYHEVRTVLSDRRFSSDVTRPGFPLFYAGQKDVVQVAPSFIRSDPPEHTRLRRTLTKEFLSSHVETLRPTLQDIVDQLVDDILTGPQPADLVDALALAVPSTTIALLLGVPYEQRAMFQDLTKVNLSRNSSPEQTAAATQRLMDWIDQLVRAKEQHPTDDMLGRLISARVTSGELDHDDATAMTRLLLVAGHETTANMLSLTLLSLIQQPEIFQPAARDPQRLRAAIEELLRFHSIIQIGLARVAAEDVPLGELVIRAGEGVIVSLVGANHDPAAFEDPDRLDVERPRLRNVAFGFGVHQCIGQALARLEMDLVLETVARRIPTIELAVPVNDLRFRSNMTVHGLEELPVTW